MKLRALLLLWCAAVALRDGHRQKRTSTTCTFVDKVIRGKESITAALVERFFGTSDLQRIVGTLTASPECIPQTFRDSLTGLLAEGEMTVPNALAQKVESVRAMWPEFFEELQAWREKCSETPAELDEDGDCDVDNAAAPASLHRQKQTSEAAGDAAANSGAEDPPILARYVEKEGGCSEFDEQLIVTAEACKEAAKIVLDEQDVTLIESLDAPFGCSYNPHAVRDYTVLQNAVVVFNSKGAPKKAENWVQLCRKRLLIFNLTQAGDQYQDECHELVSGDSRGFALDKAACRAFAAGFGQEPQWLGDVKITHTHQPWGCSIDLESNEIAYNMPPVDEHARDELRKPFYKYRQICGHLL